MFPIKVKILPVFLSCLVCLCLVGGCGTPAAAPTAPAPTATDPPPTVIMLQPTATSLPPTATPEPVPTPTSTSKPSIPDPPRVPVPQMQASMAYDSESGKVILVSGPIVANPGSSYSTYLSYPVLECVWVFDFGDRTWQPMLPADPHPATGGSAMAYDSQSDRVILYLGEGTNWRESISETWAYDYNTNTWQNMQPEGGPFGLQAARMVYDSESDRSILYAGFDPAIKNTTPDTWAYDYESNTWTKMSPAPVSYNEQWAWASMSYDAGADRLIAWRFQKTGLPPYDKVEIYDYNTDTWEIRHTLNTPGENLVQSAMVYDAATRLNILYGGWDTFANKSSKFTWAYDYASNTWKRLIARNAPPARDSHTMVAHSDAGLILLFGGSMTTTRFSPGGGNRNNWFTNETWIYDTLADEWSLVPAPP